MEYKEPLFRPPSEANSLIIQVAYGCPHNTCLFCPMYKSVKYTLRKKEDIFNDIDEAARIYPGTRRIFLADGDVMALSFSYLEQILMKLNELFPRLIRISLYSNGSSILNKTIEELISLKKLKLHTLYMGLESGDNEVLKLVEKNETSEKMIKAAHHLESAGLRLCVFALLGLGGKKRSYEHAVKTAEAINKMAPKIFTILRFINVEESKMYEGYETVSEYESVLELYNMINGLELKNTIFRSDHSSVPIALSGRFPNDKEFLLNGLKKLLNGSKLSKKSEGFTPYWL
ncbi:MAG TPA: radical SAM protein [Victivallales bacterium]|nr:radical SAM protein [Victivallales bacterium]